MTQKIVDLLPEGFRDTLHSEAEIVSNNANAMIDILSSHGYDRVMPTIAEHESGLIGRMKGLERNHLLRFTDPSSGRTLALRSDMTVQIGRIASTRLANQPRPLRLCYQGTVVKLQTDQLNPNREMRQLGAELIGSDSVAAASEIVKIAIEALQAIGVSGITVDFTLPDLVETLAQDTFPLLRGDMEHVREQLDMKDASGLKAFGADAYLPLLSATGEFDEAIHKLSAIDAGGVLSSRIEGLKSIAAQVADDVHITLDPTERHGFEYQSWFGFTLFADTIAGSLGRGGTYSLGNRADEVATGFSLYPDVLNDVFEGQQDVRIIFLPMDHDQRLAKDLRGQGWKTISALSDLDSGQKLGCSHYLDGQDIIAY